MNELTVMVPQLKSDVLLDEKVIHFKNRLASASVVSLVGKCSVATLAYYKLPASHKKGMKSDMIQ